MQLLQGGCEQGIDAGEEFFSCLTAHGLVISFELPVEPDVLILCIQRSKVHTPAQTLDPRCHFLGSVRLSAAEKQQNDMLRQMIEVL